MEPQQLYTQLDLGYDYSVIAPHISEELLRLHHDKHQVTDVTGGTSSSCAAIESAIAWISLSIGSIVPIDWFRTANTHSLCLQCSLCLQPHGAAD
jgi:hypothetical protein